MLQSESLHPSSQTQTPLLHFPLPLQLFGQLAGIWLEQSFPKNPASQLQFPFTQSPLPEQEFGHSLKEQSSPAKPSVHTHLPATHLPFIQLPHGIFGACEQSFLVYPSSHAHLFVSFTHVPCPEHTGFPGQLPTEQSSPVNPALHTQPVVPHVPFPLQTGVPGQPLVEQSAPV